MSPVHDIAAMGRAVYLEALVLRAPDGPGPAAQVSAPRLSHGIVQRLLARTLPSATRWHHCAGRCREYFANTPQSWCGSPMPTENGYGPRRDGHVSAALGVLRGGHLNGLHERVFVEPPWPTSDRSRSTSARHRHSPADVTRARQVCSTFFALFRGKRRLVSLWRHACPCETLWFAAIKSRDAVTRPKCPDW